MGTHKNLGVGDIHVPYQWTYADATARTGATGFVSSDLGKLARQLDDNSLWQLTATTPTWKSVDAGSGGGVDTTAIHKTTSAEISALTEKTTPVSADVLLMEDSAASFGKKKVTVGNVLAQQVFGQSFQTAASSARSTTTSLTYQTKVTLTTPALTGTFRIGWTAALDHNSVSSSAKLRCYNQTDGAVIGAEQLKEFQDALNIETLSGFGYVTFTGSAKTFTLDYCCATANTTGIQAAVLEFWRVS